jgi:MoxR-like ATPase
VLLGKDNQVRLAVACLLAHGHLLIEDLPGVGKTTLAEALARSFGLDWKRVSFTSDLLPADLNGVDVFDPASGRFQFQSGPLFSQVLQADEINRASPRTQSALLEAMVAGRVSSPAWRPWPAAAAIQAAAEPAPLAPIPLRRWLAIRQLTLSAHGSNPLFEPVALA